MKTTLFNSEKQDGDTTIVDKIWGSKYNRIAIVFYGALTIIEGMVAPNKMGFYFWINLAGLAGWILLGFFVSNVFKLVNKELVGHRVAYGWFSVVGLLIFCAEMFFYIRSEL